MRELTSHDVHLVSGGMGAGHSPDSAAKADRAFRDDLAWLAGFADGFWAGL